MEWVLYSCNRARRYEEGGGLLGNRYSCQVLAITKKEKEEGEDLMVHSVASLYQVVMELVIMAKFN